MKQLKQINAKLGFFFFYFFQKLTKGFLRAELSYQKCADNFEKLTDHLMTAELLKNPNQLVVEDQQEL